MRISRVVQHLSDTKDIKKSDEIGSSSGPVHFYIYGTKVVCTKGPLEQADPSFSLVQPLIEEEKRGVLEGNAR